MSDETRAEYVALAAGLEAAEVELAAAAEPINKIIDRWAVENQSIPPRAGPDRVLRVPALQVDHPFCRRRVDAAVRRRRLRTTRSGRRASATVRDPRGSPPVGERPVDGQSLRSLSIWPAALTSITATPRWWSTVAA